MKIDLVRRRLSHKVWWVDIESPGEFSLLPMYNYQGEADVQKLSQKFNLHPLTAEEVLFPGKEKKR